MTWTTRGLMAEFATPDALIAATKAARRRGYVRLDAFAPYPIPEMARVLAAERSPILWVALAAGVVGAIVQYAAQYWMNVVDYPINVGGRPLDSWPPFVLGPLIVAFLWGAVAIFLSFLALTGLPRLHHPTFDHPGFERATADRFFLFLSEDDPQFDPDGARRFLESLRPVDVRRAGPS